LTLRFIGTVNDPTAADITAVLLQIEAPCFMLSLSGVGHFGGHTLWIGVLIFLQGRIEDRLQQIDQAFCSTCQTGASQATPRSAIVSG
jgi:2'-5' RNA ligase